MTPNDIVAVTQTATAIAGMNIHPVLTLILTILVSGINLWAVLANKRRTA